MVICLLLLAGWLTCPSLATAQLPPTITAGPTNQVVTLAGTVTLGVTAGGGTPQAYQWFKDSRLILGATNSTLTLANAGVTNSGTYYVVVTNMSGMTISLPASVAVGNPSLLAWGYNNSGQLGIGRTSYYTNWPVSVASNMVAGAAGYGHSLFVTTDGTLWAMGNNQSGQLGNGTSDPSPNPTPISVASNVVAVTAGYAYSLFVTTDGTLWAMGWNSNGQLGNGTTSNANLPVSVASNVVAVAAGGTHSLFVKTDGTLWAMGANYNGQLGNGTTSDTNLPVSVASNVVAVAAGFNHSLFVTSDGTLWATGANYNGQLGNGTTSDTNLPISVPHLSVANIFPADPANHSLALGINYTANSISLPGGIPTITFIGIPGTSYSVERSTDLNSWSVIWTTNEPSNGVFQFTDPIAPQPNAYYRLQSNP